MWQCLWDSVACKEWHPKNLPGSCIMCTQLSVGSSCHIPISVAPVLENSFFVACGIWSLWTLLHVQDFASWSLGVNLSEPRVAHCSRSFCVVCALAWSRLVLACSALHARDQQIIVASMSTEYVDGATIKSWQQRWREQHKSRSKEV